VEDAILSAAEDRSCILFERIAAVLAFSTPHKVLQEVVGVVIVTTSGEKRPDLRQIQEGLKSRLEQHKWPGTVVYMNELPKIGSKLCRISLSDQLGLPTLTDKTPTAECHYEGQFPLSGTSLRQCRIDPHLVEASIKQASGISDVLMRVNQLDGFLQAILFKSSSDSIPVDKLLASLRMLVDGYLVPSTVKVLDGPRPINAHGMIDHAAVDAAIETMNMSSLSPTDRRVCGLFSEMLQCPVDNITSSTDFFTSGGDSMSAGRLVSRLRQEFRVRLAADIVFRHSTVGEISHLIDTSVPETASKEFRPDDHPGCSETYSSTNPVVLILNLLPIGIFYPMLLSLHWVLFIYLMSETSSRVTS
jgi:acyl carrier protein